MRSLSVLLGCALVVLGEGDGLQRRELATPPRIVSDVGGSFAHLVLHFDPAAAPAVGPTYRDLLRAVAPDVAFSVVVARAEHFTRFRRLLARWGVPRPSRFRPVIVGRSITTWSRDRYTLLVRGGQRLLLVRPRPAEEHVARRNDWRVPFALAREAGAGVRVEVAPLIFDGGDLIASEEHLFATALLLERNVGGALSEREALHRWLVRQTSRRPVLIGERADQVPEHHVGMFLTPLGGRRVLVGDPDLGLSLLPETAELPGPVERRAAALERFRRVARELRAQGFEVIRTPLVPLRDSLTYVTYNNAIIERRSDGKLHAYVPQFGLEALDAAGRAVYAEQGVVVHPIDVRRVFRHNGTVRCLVNVLARQDS